MEQNDQIKEFFQQRLSDHQEVVRPEIWAAVSSAIATPVLVTTGISILSKTLIGLGIAASVIVSAYLLYSSDEKVVKAPTQQKQKAKEVPSIPNENTLVPIETKKNAIPLVVLENNDLLSSEKVVNDVNDPQIIPFESDQLPNTDPMQDMGENVSNDPVKSNNDFIVMPQVENTNESSPSPDTDQELKVVLSNVFTPNGDGTNDYLFIQSEGLQDFSVVILNQANKIVYQSTDSKFSWDGKLASGDDAPAGNYIYFVTAKSPTGKSIQQSSTLFIQR
ncbi:MAG: gliding motility-associated C-terminal domain-containing protein [Crocinitomicaceae bacterium]|nr:gliding motility-associated C-terminal domain-containing protein [Crocinitomicaceae bacterium]